AKVSGGVHLAIDVDAAGHRSVNGGADFFDELKEERVAARSEAAGAAGISAAGEKRLDHKENHDHANDQRSEVNQERKDGDPPAANVLEHHVAVREMKINAVDRHPNQ